MESASTPSLNKIPTPLFPAYSSDVQIHKENKDWLCNSSFTESAFKQTSQYLSLHNEIRIENLSPAPIEKACVTVEKKKKPHKRKKYEASYDPSSFSVSESESVLSQLKKKTFIEDTGLSFERAFHTDATRDSENLMFECFEKTKIAKYHKLLKFPIGLSTEELLYWSLSLPKKKVKDTPRYFSKIFLKSMKNTNSAEAYITKEPLKSICLEYIPLNLISNQIQQCTEKTEHGPYFIDVSSSWKIEKSVSEKSVNDQISSDSSTENYVREKVIYYNKKLTENPNDIEMWLDFVDFQDQLMMSDKEIRKKGNTLNENCIIEKKVAILDKALKYNPRNVNLRITKLKISQHFYDTDQIMSMWDNLIFCNPNNPEVWQGYLLFVISNLTTFNTSSILKLYSKCLRTLSNLCEGVTQSHKPLADIVPNMLGILSQLCYILRSCGYSEKAIALYQALTEFNLFHDPCLEELSATEQIPHFEPFWDSGALRVGEKGAIGWSATVQQKKILHDYISTDSDLNNMEDEILFQKLPISETWLEFERLRQIHHWLPWRPNPEYDQTSDDVDDIDRTISFDDISKFLFCVSEEKHKYLLVVHFIVFLGFDFHFLGCNSMGDRITFNHVKVDDYENIEKELKMSQLLHHQKYPLCVSTNIWNEERFNFVNNIFSQVSNKFSEKYRILLTFIWVKFCKFYAAEIKNGNKEDIKDLKKFVKGILKKSENRNCLLLWFEYIHIEWINDKSNAVKTFQTILHSSISAVCSASMKLEELWYFVQRFLDIYLNSVEKCSREIMSFNEILWILIHIASGEKYIPFSNQEIKATMILKTVSLFKNLLEKELIKLSTVQKTLCYCMDPYGYSVINYAKCFSYFQYFSQGCDAALQVFDTVSLMSSNIAGSLGQYINEQICIAKADMLNFYTWNTATSIKPLQSYLYESVKKYPHNSKLLFLLVKLRNASSVISPIRRFLAQILKVHHKCQPVTWIFALTAEFAICNSLLLYSDIVDKQQSLDEFISCMGINWRIRSLYEKMLKSDLCTHIPILWRSYLKFEIMTQNTDKAKNIFHRAVQNCGWSKELLMDGIMYFPEQVNQILALMAEKEIRFHTPLEEVTLLMEHAVTDL